MKNYIDPEIADKAVDTLEDAIRELNMAHYNSDSTYGRNELEKLIERMYNLKTFIEISQD